MFSSADVNYAVFVLFLIYISDLCLVYLQTPCQDLKWHIISEHP